MPEWEPYDEQQRLALVRELHEEHPHLDLENSLGGALAGPASPDRPDLPVWDYLDFVETHPATSLSQLTAVRFPVLYFEGVSSVTSIDEDLRPLPSHLKSVPRTVFVIDAEALIQRYVMEHDAGLVEWDPRSRGIRYLAAIADRRPVMEAWATTLSRVPGSSVRVVAERFEYGDSPMQYGLFRRAGGSACGTIVLIHGGFWRGTAEYFDGPSPLAEALVARGWHVWQIEYRQLPNGGGWPGTLDDTAAAIEHLAVVADALHVELGPVITVGHSAGGHLAVWALSRPDAVLALTGAVSLAGALNLLLGEQEDIGDGAVTGFLGGSSADHPDRYAAADPMSRIEPRLPVRIVHGDLDDVVPMNQSETYVAAAREAGQDVDLAVVAGGDHMVVIEPGHPAFEALLVALDRIRATA